MNVQLLIHSLVKETTLLIAQLATSAGLRAPLASVANQVFLDLVRELETQGVGRKVQADMFGLALRSFQKKINRLSECSTEKGRTLWEAVFAFLQDEQLTTGARVMTRFRHDDDAMVRGVLNDLVESGLVFRTGRGDQAAYRLASEAELHKLGGESGAESVAHLVWITIYRMGPVSRAKLSERLGLDPANLSRALTSLTSDHRIELYDQGGAAMYRCSQFVVPIGSDRGWEAAVLDHYQAVVRTICAKLAQIGGEAPASADTGGSTYSFDVWPNHPCETEAQALLPTVRELAASLRERVMAHNTSVEKPECFKRVTFYAGQYFSDQDQE